MSTQGQTEAHGLPLLHAPRHPLQPFQQSVFAEAAVMRKLSDEADIPEVKAAFGRRVEHIVRRLRPILLVPTHRDCGKTIDPQAVRDENDNFWRQNINHAAMHLRTKLS